MTDKDFYENYNNLTTEEKLYELRNESNRIWSYLREAIEWIENRYYLCKELDEKELLAYCKSCEESYEIVTYLSHALQNELKKNESID